MVKLRNSVEIESHISYLDINDEMLIPEGLSFRFQMISAKVSQACKSGGDNDKLF